MPEPKHQAEFFKLLSKVLYYIVSGNSRVGVLTRQPWSEQIGTKKADAQPEAFANDATEPDRRSHTPEASKKLPSQADFETPQIYDCIYVRPYAEQQITVGAGYMDEEGILDGESEVEDDDLDDDEKTEALFNYRSPPGYDMQSSREGSPMNIS